MKDTEVRRIVSDMFAKNIEWRSGKWYYKTNEIYSISRYLFKIYNSINTMRDIDNVTSMFIDQYGEAEADWYDTTVVRDAKKLLEGSESLPELPVTLDEKQLKFINRVLLPKDDHMYIVTGRGGTGKSTFINIVRQLFDNNDVVTLDLDDLSNGFMLAGAAGKRLIVSEELSDTVERNTKLKQIVSREPIKISPKFERTRDVRMQASLLFACNVPPKFDLSDNNGMGRRVVYYRMDKPIENPDINIKDKVLTHEERVIIAAHALSLDMSDWFEDFKQDTYECLCETNSVYLYSNREFKDCSDAEYISYADKCRECGASPQSKERWERTKKLMILWGMWHV